MRRTLLLTLCLGLCGVVWCAQAQEATPSPSPAIWPRIAEAVIDETGLTWGIELSTGYTGIYSFDGRQWQRATLPFPEDAAPLPVELAVRSDGSVVCVWRLKGGVTAVSRHLGAKSEILVPSITAEMPKNRYSPAVYPDSHNRLWIMAGEGQVYRIEGNGATDLAYELSAEDRAGGPEPGAQRWNPLVAAEDGKGRMWIWTKQVSKSTNCLRGVLIFDGKTMSRQDTFPGANADCFTAILRKDARNMWVGVPERGLFTVDIESMQATAVPGSVESLSRIAELYQHDGDLYAYGFRDPPKTLWRLRDGQWTAVVEAFEQDPRTQFWLPVGKDLIVGARGMPWYLPPDGPAVRLDWGNGFPIARVRAMLRLPDGRFLLATGTAPPLIQKLVLPPPAAPASRVTELFIQEGLAVDSRGHVWYQRKDRRDTLEEWDGRTWREHTLPASVPATSHLSCVADAQGRFWVMASGDHGPVAYLDTTTDKWAEFPDAMAAFQSVAGNPPQFIETPAWPLSSRGLRPAFHGKQIAFANESLCYFDGEKWRSWTEDQIEPPPRTGGLSEVSFDESGHLVATIGTHLARWNGTAFEMSPARVEPSRPPAPIILPDGSKPTSHLAARDNFGIVWYVQNGLLLRGVPGKRELKTAVFAQGEANPFSLARILSQVYVDDQGTAFLAADTGVRRYFQIAPNHAPPQASVAIEQVNPDSIKAKIHLEAREPTVVRWQLDEEPWKELEGDSVSFDFLPSGPHVFRVSVIDGDIQALGRPAEGKFTVTADSASQIQRLMAGLSDPDFARREAAMAGLKKRPVEAAKALREARAAANDDLRWWIDAALQEIEPKPTK